MKTYTGTEKAAKGTYLNMSRWEMAQVENEGEALPGEATVKYIKVPTALGMIAGPLTGLVFLIFLPFIGIAGFVGFIAYKAFAGVKALGTRTAEALVTRPQVGEAYFTRETKGDDEDAEPDEELSALEDEVARRKAEDEEK